MWVKKQQLEPNMEQLIDLRLEKEYDKDVYCHLIYLAYMQGTSCKMPGWTNQKPRLRFPGEITISDM